VFACLAVVDELRAHPIAEIFVNPASPDEPGAADYLTIIKNPSDLGTVRRKLCERGYQTLDEFRKDVNLVLENAVQFNGRPSLISFMADRLSSVFQKSMIAIEDRSYDAWVSDYLKCQGKLCKLFRAQPRVLEEFNLSPDLEMLVPERRMAKSWLTPDDTKFFSKAFAFIEDPQQLNKLIHVLGENEPSIDFSEEELQINLAALSQRTLRMMKGWVSETRESSRRSISPTVVAPETPL
jgi:hypothetical protein